jgi:methionyl-tRNA synthetase
MSEKKFKRYTVTAALPYANGPLHIGHIAGAYLPADIYVRYLRSKGEDVAFVCGSDEYGAAITIKAKKEGTTPRQIIDKYNAMIADAFRQFGIAFDIYHRTSDAVHTKTAQDFFTVLHQNDVFDVQESEQYYDQVAGQFLADRYISGTCPNCHYDKAYGDQCEKCGTSLSPLELINPRSTLSGSVPVLRNTRHWYLPMERYEPWLREWIVKEKQEIWKTNVYGQCRSWIEQGLHSRAMTRDLDWGVPVPLEEAEGKVLYVWLDAPIGYISATKAWAAEKGKNWEDYWKSPDTRLLHFIGKDNIVFHCIIFPILLKAHGEFILPDNVPANEFLNLEGDKLSTSRNWAVWLHEYMNDFPDKQDVLRYVLGSILPENKDSEFTWKDFQARNNNELVAILGNFINRALVLTHKYYDGIVPATGELNDYDREVLEKLQQFPGVIANHIETFRFREALTEVMNVARLGNKYLADTEPWKLIKTDAERVKTIINISLQIVANLAVLAEPFLPFTAHKIAETLGLSAEQLVWNIAGQSMLKAGVPVQEAALLFAKIEDAEIERQIARLEKSRMEQSPAAPLKDEVSFEQFAGMDIRVATITAAERVPKAKKLLKLSLDTGIDQRTVVSGIAEHYEPEHIIGQQVVLLANLAPREIRGIRSQGMILMAEDKDGSLTFVQPSRKLSNGSSIS